MPIPTKILKRIDYWESKGLRKLKSKKSNIYKETVEKLTWLVNGTNVFENENHTMLDFRKSVDNFSLKALDPAFLPFSKIKLKKMSLSNFLYSPFAPTYCAYKQSLEHPPIPVYLKYPKVYYLLIDSYLRVAGNGVKSIDDLGSLDLKRLATVSNKVGKFYDKNTGKISFANSYKGVIDALLNFSLEMVKDNLTKFDTSLLDRQWIWEKFPNYLDQKGYLTSEKQFSIYN